MIYHGIKTYETVIAILLTSAENKAYTFEVSGKHGNKSKIFRQNMIELSWSSINHIEVFQFYESRRYMAIEYS